MDWLGYQEMIDSQMRLAEYLEARILETGLFETATPRRLTILNFRAKAVRKNGLSEEATAHLHREIVEEFTRDGQQWISTTRVQGRSVIRMMVISYLSEQRHVDVLAARLRIATETVLHQHDISA